MLDLITSYLLQNRECVLPSIGIFKVKNKSAEFDPINNQILPPAEEIIFREQAGLSSGLVNYISRKQMINPATAEDRLADFCTNARAIIIAGGKLELKSFGSLQKNVAGNIYFKRQKSLDYFQPVPANAAVHPHQEYDLLVGEKEITSIAMAEYLSEQETAIQSRWKLWAVILTVISIAGLIYYFSMHPFSLDSVGNTSRLF